MDSPKPVPIYDSAARRSPALEELQELLRYSNLVAQTARRNIVVRYKRSVLGIAWTMLAPLGTTLILAFVFSNVFGGTRSYAVYVLSGMLAWTFFAQGTSDSMHSLISGGSLLKRIYMPRTVFAVSAVLTGLMNMAFALVPLAVIMLITDVPIRPSLLVLPICALFLAMFALGMGLILSTFALFFADVTEMYSILLTAWMYLSPVIYTREMLPPRYSWIILFNPMYYLINLFRAPIYDGVVPPLADFLFAGGVALLFLVVGWFFFASKADEFAYRV